MRVFFSLFCILVITVNINCWWNEGHMIVANIAKQDLLKRDPEAYYLMNNLTSVLEGQRHGQVKSFVESATWPDLVKKFELNLMDPWHFRDVPVNYSDPTIPKLDSKIENNALYFLVSKDCILLILFF